LHARIFSSVSSSAVSIITFRIAAERCARSASAVISELTTVRSPDFSAPMLITMSNSLAPNRKQSTASASFAVPVVAPSGNPITVPTSTGDPCTRLTACATFAGFTITEQKPYWTASAHSFATCARVASAFNRV
jgi:hypothetical protein